MKKLLFAAALAGFGVVAVACGGDDNNGTPNPTGDGGPHDGATSSSSSSSSSSGSSSGNNDGGKTDAGCDFAAFVLDLVNNQTKDNNAPSQDLGEACTDKQDQKDFSSLFP